jgi:hypothetical protein
MATKATLSLRKRTAELGGQISGRTEYHGEDPVGACDLALAGLTLDTDECDALLGVGSWNRLYKKVRNSGMNDFPEPADFAANSKLPFQLETKFEDSRVTLHLGIADEDKVELVNCTLAKIKYKPTSGGMTIVSLQVQCNAEPEQVAKIYQHMDTHIDVAVRFGRIAAGKDENQGDLPLKAANGNGQVHDDEERAGA